MNKLLVVLLAVCLVSVHAFVKRDTGEPEQMMSNINKKMEDFSNTIKEQFSQVFDPEKIKNDFSSLIDKISEGVKSVGSSKPEDQKA